MKNPLQKKSYSFAIRIIKTFQVLKESRVDNSLSKQLLRSGTSIGANIQEATGAFSRNDFIYKISISLKEAKETQYWISLLKDTSLLSSNLAESLIQDCIELQKMLTATLKTTRNKKLQKETRL